MEKVLQCIKYKATVKLLLDVQMKCELVGSLGP